MAGPEDGPVYALNLFDLADNEEYLAYSRRSAREVAAHGGRVGGHGPRLLIGWITVIRSDRGS